MNRFLLGAALTGTLMLSSCGSKNLPPMETGHYKYLTRLRYALLRINTPMVLMNRLQIA